MSAYVNINARTNENATTDLATGLDDYADLNADESNEVRDETIVNPFLMAP